jgi:hypothetical protein
MIRHDPEAPGRARVIGSLTGDALQVLWPARCTLLTRPRWLELWLVRVRRHGTRVRCDGS